MIKWIISLAFLAGSCSEAYALSIQEDRVVVINAVIANGNLLNLTSAMEEMIAKDAKRPIDMIINSPGGSVNTGFVFLNYLESVKGRGITVRCFVPQLAASMAFQILVHCDQRYTLSKSLLLWHGARVSSGGMFGQPLTEQGARVIYHSLRTLNRLILSELATALDMPEHAIKYHFLSETLHTGEVLARMAPRFIKSYPYIEGLNKILIGKDVKVPRIDGAIGSTVFRSGELIYIMPESGK